MTARTRETLSTIAARLEGAAERLDVLAATNGADQRLVLLTSLDLLWAVAQLRVTVGMEQPEVVDFKRGA